MLGCRLAGYSSLCSAVLRSRLANELDIRALLGGFGQNDVLLIFCHVFEITITDVILQVFFFFFFFFFFL